MPEPRRAARLKIALVLICAAFVYLIGNASVPLWNQDEPRYAQTSRQMLASGEWIVPRLLEEVRTAKPIFIYWCQIISMKVFGDNEFAARFPSAVAMLMTLLLLAVIIQRTVGPRRAVWTVFILASSALVIATAKLCITDSVLLLWVTMAQVCLLAIYVEGSGVGDEGSGVRVQGSGDARWESAGLNPSSLNPEPRTLNPVSMWTAIALAGLTKGPVVLGIMLTTMIALTLFDAGRGFRSGLRWIASFRWWRHTRPLLGIVIIGVICGPWLYLIEQRAPGFIRTSIGHDVIHRSRIAIEGHSGPPGYYLASIWLTCFPWSLLLPAALVYAWRRRSNPIHRYCLAAIVGPWIMFELVQTKLVHYLLPIFPALAFLTADMLINAARQRDSVFKRHAFFRIVTIWSIVVALAGIVAWLPKRYFALSASAMAGATILTLVCVVYAASVCLQFRLRRPLRAAAFMGAGMFLFVTILFGVYLPSADFLHTSPRLAHLLRSEGAVDPGDAIAIDFDEDSLAFYQGGTIRRAANNAYLLHTERWDWPRCIVLTDELWRATPPEIQRQFHVVGRVRGWWYDRGRTVEVLVIRKISPFALLPAGGR